MKDKSATIIINSGFKDPGHIKDGDTVSISLMDDLKSGYHNFKIKTGYEISESTGLLLILDLVKK